MIMPKLWIALALALTYNSLFCQKINQMDRQNRRQGYWKVYLPSQADLKNNVREGFYFNNKLIGVWTIKTANGDILEEEIFYDTLTYKVQENKYFLNHNLRSSGFTTSVPYADSLLVIDPKHKKATKIHTQTRQMRQGKWTFYHETGTLESEGSYKDDLKVGKWKYYGESGQLMKTEEL
jgi:antitoxin component YwqK of YwqJK toxin-antitoxin module